MPTRYPKVGGRNVAQNVRFNRFAHQWARYNLNIYDPVFRYSKIFGLAILCLIALLIQGCAQTAFPSRFSDYTTKTHLVFPLRGESLVVNGGRTLAQNAHAIMQDQRFALDIVALAPGSAARIAGNVDVQRAITNNGNPKDNNTYFIFGREVIAPANGTVVNVLNNIPDAIPSESHYDYNNPAGNFVVIDHGNSEFSMIAHLKYGSVRVNIGDRISTGHVVGLVGNSGNSTEPHLHYHLQNTPNWGAGEGLPAQFNGYMANGKLIARGEPVQGQIITIR